MADLLDGIARHLAAAGIGTYTPAGPITEPWPITLDGLPAEPVQAITLHTYPGGTSEPSLPFQATRVQVRVRGDADSRTSRGKADAILSALHGLGPLALPGGVWLQLAFELHGGPIGIGPDQAGAHEHTINFEMSWENPTTHRPAP